MDSGLADQQHDSLWYKDAVFYELHARSFFDSDNNGKGDFAGMAMRLDYVRELGVDCIWIQPFYPSPLLDDGYDISDFTGIHPDFGTLEDFRRLVEAAHERGLKVLVDFIMNHCSDTHAWFQEARHDRNSPKRDYFVWSDDPTRYGDARIIFRRDASGVMTGFDVTAGMGLIKSVVRYEQPTFGVGIEDDRFLFTPPKDAKTRDMR